MLLSPSWPMQLALIVCVAACWPPPALALRLPLGPWSGRVGTGGIASTVGAPGAPIVPIASRGLRRFQPKLGFYEAVELMDKSVQVVKRIPKFDCSSGAGRLSVPQQHLASVLDDAGRAERDRTGMPPVGPLLRAHQVGKKAVGQLPDAALLGALVLVSNELIKREYTSKFTALSPYIRDLANSTLAELNTKLETLSELEWSVENFLAKETDALSARPLEIIDFIDQYLVRDLLPRIDKELSPFLSTLITDPAEVQKITVSVKNLVQLATLVLLRPSEAGLEGWEKWGTYLGLRTNSGLSSLVEKGAGRILVGVDEAGSLVERLLEAWNKGIASTGDMFRKDSVLREGSVLNEMMDGMSTAHHGSVNGHGGGGGNADAGEGLEERKVEEGGSLV